MLAASQGCIDLHSLGQAPLNACLLLARLCNNRR